MMFVVPAIPAPATDTALTVTARLRKEQPVTVKERQPDGTTIEKKVPMTVMIEESRKLDPSKCAVVICDMWDNHWCPSAARRCDVLAKQAAPVIAEIRNRGMTIVHCPSDCMGFYADHAARKRTLALPPAELPKLRDVSNPPLPIDDSDGGCDDLPQPKTYRAWKRQHAAIEIDAEKDFITDNGKDLFAVMKSKGLDTVIVMGVHTNMCVLNRSFAIKQLRKWDVPCYLVRDFTDAMYNPRMPPKVSHADGTHLVIEYIEKNWCPSILSKDLIAGK